MKAINKKDLIHCALFVRAMYQTQMKAIKRINFSKLILSFTTTNGIITSVALAFAMYQKKATVNEFSITFLVMIIIATAILGYHAVTLDNR